MKVYIVIGYDSGFDSECILIVKSSKESAEKYLSEHGGYRVEEWDVQESEGSI